MWNRTLVYLGLREEPEDDYDELPERFVPEDDPHAQHAPERPHEREREREPERERQREPAAVAARGSRDERAAAEARERSEARGRAELRDTRLIRDERVETREESNVRPLRTGDVHVRAVPPTPLVRAAVVELEVFDDAEAIAARYRTGQPVLFDLRATDSATARRVVDFVSGVTYALRGRLTKVGARAFLLLPDGVELSAEEQRRLSELGYRLPLGTARSAE
jgi:cell division inhibitor SepF